MRDRTGRRRSSRSIPTGPGSRGGKWGHRPTSGYWREYRASHPAYRARDHALRAERRRVAALARDRAKVDAMGLIDVPALGVSMAWGATLHWIRIRIIETGASLREVADHAGIDHSALSRILGGRREPLLTTVVAIVWALGGDLRPTLDERAGSPQWSARLARGVPPA